MRMGLRCVQNSITTLHTLTIIIEIPVKHNDTISPVPLGGRQYTNMHYDTILWHLLVKGLNDAQECLG